MTIVEKLRGGVTTASAAESQALAAELAAVLPADTVLALHGNLGTGKTTFVQGLARGLGIGSKLFERAAIRSRNTQVTTLYIHCLSRNATMMHIAR
ncbi:MAG: tRNA (adenosine(37)-N6)-threonylcarbamoyltransferase complex ATPase subunit type 1 TsaE, partial [Opitutaceae bacterium]|nr:tRNA (adenosine(37)-N6)-threonylcarbamoyltransferase complex ATPase subunit type 1 TsaE [Opitutaceae bacterium]